MLQQAANTLINASIYALFALGYALVFGVLDVVLDYAAVAPLRARGADFLAPLISTLAASAIFVNVALASFGADSFSFPAGSFPNSPITLGSVVVRPVQIVIVGLAVLLMVA